MSREIEVRRREGIAVAMTSKAALRVRRQDPTQQARVFSSGCQTTAAILTGAIDPLAAFAELAREDCEETMGYRGVLGYCQIVQRPVIVQTPYPEEFDNIAKSDVEWNRRLAEHQGVQPALIPGLRVLHLHHPRNWNGTEVFL